jgi:hypothetical protein
MPKKNKNIYYIIKILIKKKKRSLPIKLFNFLISIDKLKKLAKVREI